jgi:hypothetical protein
MSVAIVAMEGDRDDGKKRLTLIRELAANIIANMKFKQIIPRWKFAFGQKRAIGAAIVIGDHFRLFDPGLPIHGISGDANAFGGDALRGVQDMGGQIAFGHDDFLLD